MVDAMMGGIQKQLERQKGNIIMDADSPNNSA
jgi:hypothetical protein